MAAQDVGLKHFYTEAPPKAPETKSYGDYSKGIWGEQGGVEASGGEIRLPEKALQETAAQIGEKVIKLGQGLKEVTDMLLAARISHDPYGRGLDKVVEKYSGDHEPPIQKVLLPEELVAQYGGDANKIKFGALTLDGDRDKADVQLKRLQELAEAGKPYLGDMEVHTVVDKKGKRVAIVIGTDEKFTARAFNGISNAVQSQQDHTEHLEVARNDLDKAMKEAKKEPEFGTVDPQKMKELEAQFPKKQQTEPQEQVGMQISPQHTPAKEKDINGVLAVA